MSARWWTQQEKAPQRRLRTPIKKTWSSYHGYRGLSFGERSHENVRFPSRQSKWFFLPTKKNNTSARIRQRWEAEIVGIDWIANFRQDVRSLLSTLEANKSEWCLMAFRDVGESFLKQESFIKKSEVNTGEQWECAARQRQWWCMDVC